MFDYNEYLSSRIQQLKDAGSYRYFLEVNKSAQHFPHFYYGNDEGVQRSAINWCSNDYLCMSTHEEVIAKLSFTSHRSGAGSGGTRNISGTTIHHRELEQTLASWHEKDNALLFAGAYLANVTALQTLGRHIPDLVFISDERNHASMIEGIRASGNTKIIFRHNDMVHLEEILKSLPLESPKLIAFETIYSITGAVAPLAAIVALSKKYNALTYADEVHAVGLYGDNGAGMLRQEGLQKEVDVINGTLSKAIGVFGGYIASSKTIIDFIRSYGSGFIFTTSLPPAICSAANKSIQVIQEDVAIRRDFKNNVQQLRAALEQASIEFKKNNSHITSVPVAGAAHCREMALQLLHGQGVYLQPINFPTVPKGEECLRIIITARHQPKHINHLAHSLKKVLYGSDSTDWKKFPAVSAAD
jgi:5-aminolevulinate synthase